MGEELMAGQLRGMGDLTNKWHYDADLFLVIGVTNENMALVLFSYDHIIGGIRKGGLAVSTFNVWWLVENTTVTG